MGHAAQAAQAVQAMYRGRGVAGEWADGGTEDVEKGCQLESTQADWLQVVCYFCGKPGVPQGCDMHELCASLDSRVSDSEQSPELESQGRASIVSAAGARNFALDLAPIAEGPSSRRDSAGHGSEGDCWDGGTGSSIVLMAPGEKALASIKSLSHASTAPPSTASSNFRFPKRSARRSLVIGRPVSFYVDGCPKQYFGRIRAISSNGSYTVDLVGGGRMPHLERVTACSEDDLLKEEQLKLGLIMRKDSYADYSLLYSDRSDKTACRTTVAVGTPVSFCLEGHNSRFFGRVREVAPNGTCTVDMVGGGRRAGVLAVAACSEEDLLKESRLKLHLNLQKDPYIRSPNAPSDREGGPLSARGTARSGGRASPRTRSKSRSAGCPVTFDSGNVMKPFFGRVKAVEPDGTFTVDLVNGGRRRGVADVTPCSEQDLEKASKSTQGLHTGRDHYVDLHTRNATPRVLRSRSSPSLRGVAITRVLPAK